MSSAFPLPFKVDNQVIWQNHPEILHHLFSCRGFIPPFHLKPVHKYEQLFHKENQNNYIKGHLFEILHLHISVNTAVVKYKNYITQVYDDDADKIKSSVNIASVKIGKSFPQKYA